MHHNDAYSRRVRALSDSELEREHRERLEQRDLSALSVILGELWYREHRGGTCHDRVTSTGRRLRLVTS